MQLAPNFCFLWPEKQYLCLNFDGKVIKDGKFDFARRFLPHSRFRDRKNNFPANFPPHSQPYFLELLIVNDLQKRSCLWVLFEAPKRRVSLDNLLIINDLQKQLLAMGWKPVLADGTEQVADNG